MDTRSLRAVFVFSRSNKLYVHRSSSKLLLRSHLYWTCRRHGTQSTWGRCLATAGNRTANTTLIEPRGKPRVVVLGSGWAAISFIKQLPNNVSEHYEIVLASPRNYFLFTALLPGVATGKVEARSITESVRRLIQGKGTYYEAGCTNIDVEGRSITVQFPRHAGLDVHDFSLSYDLLVLAVGSATNTFGIEGVKEHTFMLKSIEDANNLRQRVCECFERAALPGIPQEERRRMLTFIVVGGGPTGVEVAAELYDLLHEDLRKFYADIFPWARVMLVELQDHILSSYDREISKYTSSVFNRNGIELVLNSKVESVSKELLTVSCKDGSSRTIPFGACCWATGVAMNPLVKRLQAKLPGQENFRSIVTDEHLRVKGSGGSIYAMGDAATMDQPRAREFAQDLFREFDADESGTLSFDELRRLLNAASKRFSHLEEHARFLDGQAGLRRFGGLLQERLGVLRGQEKGGTETVKVQLAQQLLSQEVTPPEFEKLLESIDSGLRALPATGQVAAQQGKYLAKLFTTHAIKPGAPLAEDAAPFRYSHGGNVAYIGTDEAVMELPRGQLKGRGAGLLWRGWETYRQISPRNRALVICDWAFSSLFGRDFEIGEAGESEEE